MLDHGREIFVVCDRVHDDRGVGAVCMRGLEKFQLRWKVISRWPTSHDCGDDRAALEEACLAVSGHIEDWPQPVGDSDDSPKRRAGAIRVDRHIACDHTTDDQQEFSGGQDSPSPPSGIAPAGLAESPHRQKARSKTVS